jgi:hypothetical protein
LRIIQSSIALRVISALSSQIAEFTLYHRQHAGFQCEQPARFFAAFFSAMVDCRLRAMKLRSRYTVS